MKAHFTLFALAAALCSSVADAQTFITQKSSQGDSVSLAVQITENVHNDIKSTGNPVVLKWNVVNFSSNITAAGTQWAADGLCDNVTCYSGGDYLLSGTPHVTDPYTSANFGIFYVILNSTNAPNNTTAWIRVQVRDTVGGTDRMLTFIGHKGSTGIVSHSVIDEAIKIFPNPATDQITVAVMEDDAVASFAIISSDGRVLSQHRMTDKVSVVSTTALPAGRYFVRLSDKSGKLVGSRSFTRH